MLEFCGGDVLLAVLLVLVVEVVLVLDWRLRKGSEGSRKVGKGEDGDGMLIGGMFVLLRYVHAMLLGRGIENGCYSQASILYCDGQGGWFSPPLVHHTDMTWMT